MKRSIWFWLCFIITIVLAIYFSVRIVMTGLGYTQISHVHNISISADQNDKDLSALAAAATIAPNTNTYSLNLENINSRISSVPGVKHSAVRRMPNGNISIRVSLHQAVALWTDGEYYYPLSADGTIVNRPSDTRTSGDIVFRGRVPSDIREITQITQNLVGDIDYLEWIEDRRWNLHTTGGITVMLPQGDATTAIGTLINLNKQHQILHKDITTLDMRDSTRILVK